MLKILLADDHAIVRDGIRSLLSRMPGMVVVGEAANGREALELADETRPDIAVLDVSMPELSGIEAARELKARHPGLRVLLLTMHSRDAVLSDALDAGVDGYLLKDAGTTELEVALRAIAQGHSYLSPALSRKVIQGTLAEQRTPLTPRQREILQLVAEGHSTKGIARRLGLSPRTVENHRRQIMDRLEIRDLAGLVRYAISIGLVPPE